MFLATLLKQFITIDYKQAILAVLLLVQAIVIVYLIARLRKKNRYRQSNHEISEAEYIRKRNQLRILIDAMPDSIYIKDREGKFVVANYTTARILGQSHPKEIFNKTAFDFLDEDLAREYEKDEIQVMKSGEPIINKEEPGLNIKGEKVIKSTTKVPFRNENGEIIGIISIDRDISNQKSNERLLYEKSEQLNEINQLLEERQEEIEHQTAALKAKSEEVDKEKNILLSLINTIPDYIYVKDNNCRFVTANEHLIRIMGAGTLENIIGKTDHDFYESSLADLFREDDEEIIKSGIPVINKEESGIDNEGELTIVSTTKYPIRNSKGIITGLVGIGRDIRKQKEVENKLREQSDNLQEVNALLEERQEEIQQQSEELSAQSDHLQEVNMKLEQLNRTKNKFFSIIAHDLKNPFHVILGFSDILLTNLASYNKDKIRELLEMIQKTTNSAYNLLENLLNWSRTQTESIKYNPDYQSLSFLLEENFAYFSSIAQSKNIHLLSEIEPDCSAYFDRDMINTIVRNLLNNAIKFTQKEGSITLACKQLDKLRCQVSITDTGVGISAERQKKLFRIDQYYSTSGTEGETGTGLGLIITKEFIVKNKGTISVSSQQGKGTTFTFTLPIDSYLKNT